MAGFIKLIKGEALEEMLRTDPNAFCVLTQVAMRAKRTNNHPSHFLEMGEALIGDYKACGLTRQTYRTSLVHLEKAQILTTKPTNRGTIAKIIKSNIYDINAEEPNHQANHQPTISQPLTRKGRVRRMNKTPLTPQIGGRVEDALLVLSHLNKKKGAAFKDTGAIEKRLKAGGSVEDCFKIIENKFLDPHFIKNPRFLTPQTLFSARHWDKYLNDVPPSTVGGRGETPPQPDETEQEADDRLRRTSYLEWRKKHPDHKGLSVLKSDAERKGA